MQDKSILDITVSKYKGFNNGIVNGKEQKGYKRVGNVNLLKFLTANEQADVILQIRKEIDEEKQKELKSLLFAVTISGYFLGRRTLKSQFEHTCLLCLDFDKFSSHEQQLELEQWLSAQPYIAFVGKSVRNKVFAIARIKPEQHLAAFASFTDLFASKGIVLDVACKDITRIRYSSIQINPYINHHPTVYEPEKKYLVAPPKTETKQTKEKNTHKLVVTKETPKLTMTDEIQTRKDIISCISYLNNARKLNGVLATLDFVEGQRHNFVIVLAGTLKSKNIDSAIALSLLKKMYPFDEHAETNFLNIYERYPNETESPIALTPQTEQTPIINEAEETTYNKNQENEQKYESYNGEYENSDMKFKKIQHWLFSNHKVEYNEIRNQLQINGKEADREEIEYLLFNHGFTGIKDMLKPILTCKYVRKVNPIKDFFKNHKATSNKDYIKELCSYIQTDNNAFFETHLKKHLVRAVACALEGNVNKYCLTLFGGQHNGKTSLIRWLHAPFAPSYFAEPRSRIAGDKDQHFTLCENIGILLDEVDRYPKQDVAEMKALFSRSTVKERLPFGTNKKEFNRICSFWATTNEREILHDATGNVRWIIAHIKSINHENGGKKGYSSINPVNIWMQAYQLYLSGFDANLTDEDVKASEENNNKYKTISMEQELVEEYFTPCLKGDKDAQHCSATEIMCYLNEQLNGHARVINVNLLGRALGASGFEKKQNNNQKWGYYLKYNKITQQNETQQNETQQNGSAYLENIANLLDEQHLPQTQHQVTQ